MESKKKSPSWVVIIILFIVFWPIGVFLMVKRISNDKLAAGKYSKILMGIGIFFLFGAFVMLTQWISGETDAFGFFFYLIGGSLIIYSSKRVKASGERYKKLIDIVINQQQHIIENIAVQMNLGYNETVKVLQKMIDKGYFVGAYIDHGNHEIVFANKSIKSVMKNVTPTQFTQKQKTIKCPNCGGNNIINIGQVCECDYCGSPIE